jgi:hypothetical protein
MTKALLFKSLEKVTSSLLVLCYVRPAQLQQGSQYTINACVSRFITATLSLRML